MNSTSSLATRPTVSLRRAAPVPEDRALRFASDDRVTRQFRRVTEAVVCDFPLDQGGSIVFASAGTTRHVAELGWQVAQQLALRQVGTILLVDCDGTTHSLTERFGLTAEPGLAEVLQRAAPIASTAVTTGIDHLRLVPTGDRRLARNPLASDTVQQVLRGLRQQYRYTIVLTGMQRSNLLAMLGRHSDGTYLVVQLGAAKREDTSELANYLARAGARLLGCIATSSV